MKSYLRQRFPKIYRGIQNWKYRYFPSSWIWPTKPKMAEVNWLVLEEFDWKVAAGPFSGMKYIGESRCSVLGAKILGVYEREILPVIEEVIREPYNIVIDIGSAEGYYAVGFALRMPKAIIHAFDTDVDARKLTAQLASLNGVENRIVIHENCDPQKLSEFQGKSAFLLCDIDGGEVEVLDPIAAPVLLSMDLLVEIHDGKNSTSIRDLLVSRFSKTHDITWFTYQERDEVDGRTATWLRTPEARMLAVDEGRVSGFDWAYFRKKQ